MHINEFYILYKKNVNFHFTWKSQQKRDALTIEIFLLEGKWSAFGKMNTPTEQFEGIFYHCSCVNNKLAKEQIKLWD
jgi:hypothetical protein